MISATSRSATWAAFIKAFWPQTQRVDAREKWRICIGAFFGIFIAGMGAYHFSHDLLGMGGVRMAWLIAPLGASAVLVFAVPSSPLAQPWSVIGGNTLSALVGIACLRWLPDPMIAAAMAVAGAIALMFALRCLHPPGGASALLMVLAGVDQFAYALTPVFVDSLLLVLSGLVYNNLSGRPWPHALGAAAPQPALSSRFSQADLDAALLRYNQVVDMNADDLADILRQAEANAYQRTLGEWSCADVMTTEPHLVPETMPLHKAWGVMRGFRIKALPVLDGQQRLVGIVTTADFMKQIDLDAHEGVAWRLRSLLRRGIRGRNPKTVGDIMSKNVQTAQQDQPLVDAIPIFTAHNHRHMPIVDGEGRVVGMLTQSDLVKALHQTCAGLPSKTKL
ncbi:HPP family protein [Lampropedia puyangensis]|uniref:HPP family protein n=1 Tax=Lampropedia puyangensis TaxID=1330072 RepID=A0A4S8EUA8_9BURK|nr:HPP family protein [Lampropedia puyangensis]THT98439.1 HPP family protein [Lampropedia puyangensis]